MTLGARSPHGGRQLSVRNMVPTLTSRKRRGLSLNGRCQAIRDMGFILVPAEGAVRPAEACSRHCIPQHRGCLLWGSYKQGGRGSEASKSLVEDIVGELENEYVVCCVLSDCLVSRPLRLGGSPPFYRSRGRRITCVPRYLATWGSATCYAVEWAAVRTILAAIWSSWPTMYPNSGGSRVEGRRMVAMSSDRLEGGAEVGLYGAQE
jgi:hypothetical protein